MTGTLYIVSTPIGNLEDITLRTLRILKEVDLIIAEDTRISKKLLIHYEIDIPIMSYHHHSSVDKKEEILRELVIGKNIALVTDAGTPGISDPGNELIDYLITKEPSLSVVPIPGASAITAALSISGIRSDRFLFMGFMPKKKRTKLFKWIKEGSIAFAYYESPFRVIKSLEAIQEFFGNVNVVLARELTKMYEEVVRGNIEEVISRLQTSKIKGEIVVIVDLTK